jgi:hypothetical protein
MVTFVGVESLFQHSISMQCGVESLLAERDVETIQHG